MDPTTKAFLAHLAEYVTIRPDGVVEVNAQDLLDSAIDDLPLAIRPFVHGAVVVAEAQLRQNIEKHTSPDPRDTRHTP